MLGGKCCPVARKLNVERAALVNTHAFVSPWELKFNSRVPNYGQKAVRRVTHVAAAVQIGLW